ncbi:hypothetical protein ACVNIS_05475 [Sphaerotilaceae bacterium SBD11-9]
MKAKLQSLAVALVAIAVSILLAEGAARLVIDPADFLNVTPVPDEILGHKLAPGASGHDALGFRNREVPKQADTVVIGDSMTYGSGAPRETAWPQQLGELRHETVYNMGMGGYGPLQYLHLARTQAKTFKPRHLVVGFYFGNDLLDAHIVAHALPYWDSWRAGDVAAATVAPAGVPEPQRRFGALRDWLAHHSLLYGLLRATVFAPFAVAEQKNMAQQVSLDHRMSWADPAAPEIKTVFTAYDRTWVQDLSQANVREGMQITQRAFAAIKEEADKQSVDLLVVLIPTRERVYCPYLKASGAQLPAAHLKVCDLEEVAKAELVQAFQAKGIRYVDTTGALEAQAARHVQIYPPTSDGHPTALGHRVIAEAVRVAMGQPAGAASAASK